MAHYLQYGIARTVPGTVIAWVLQEPCHIWYGTILAPYCKYHATQLQQFKLQLYKLQVFLKHLKFEPFESKRSQVSGAAAWSRIFIRDFQQDFQAGFSAREQRRIGGFSEDFHLRRILKRS